MKRAVKWLALKAVIGGFVWWGTQGGNENAMRVAGVSISLLFVVSLFTLSGGYTKAALEAEEKDKDPDNIVPQWVRTGYELFFAGWLIWWAHPVYGILALLTYLLMLGAKAKTDALLAGREEVKI